MKYLVKFFVVTLFVLIYTNSFAEQNVVFLDMKFILNNSKAGKGAQDFLQKSFKDNQKKFADIEKKLKTEEIDLISQKSTLSKDEYKTKSDNLRNKVIKYQADRKQSLDKIAKQRVDARQKLLKTLDPIIQAYMAENNVALVLDKKIVVMGNNNFNVTNAIIDKLNKELPSLSLK